jgi:hypothetical protein
VRLWAARMRLRTSRLARPPALALLVGKRPSRVWLAILIGTSKGVGFGPAPFLFKVSIRAGLLAREEGF